ncbi:hypothetical protein PIB30_092995, partial [Stylosanthes scabra]|nr:hypothetical protein [Stylosanthes scabra]
MLHYSPTQTAIYFHPGTVHDVIIANPDNVPRLISITTPRATASSSSSTTVLATESSTLMDTSGNSNAEPQVMTTSSNRFETLPSKTSPSRSKRGSFPCFKELRRLKSFFIFRIFLNDGSPSIMSANSPSTLIQQWLGFVAAEKQQRIE